LFCFVLFTDNDTLQNSFTGCFQKNTYLKKAKLLAYTAGTPSKECQLLCQKNPKCNSWTYGAIDYDYFDYGGSETNYCYLFAEDISKFEPYPVTKHEAESFTISGPKNC
jgi:hypothetical protein